MTARFDEIARETMVNNFAESSFKYNNIAIKDMTVKQIDCKTARPYIATFHYSKTMPDSSKFIYAGYLGAQLCGIVVYGMGCGKNQYTAVIPDIKNGEYIELTRLWVADDMPKNTESKLISKSLKLLPPQIKLVVSFADESRGHAGIIYQATNWYYIGVNNGGKMLVNKSGIEKHPRIISIYRERHPELKNKDVKFIMELLGLKYKQGGRKHKYIFLRGTKKERARMFERIKPKIQPYPKTDKPTDKSERDIIKECATGYGQLSLFNMFQKETF